MKRKELFVGKWVREYVECSSDEKQRQLFREQIIKCGNELCGQYGFKNLTMDEAIKRGASSGLVSEPTSVEMAMHISAVDLEFPSDHSILSHPNVFVGNTAAPVTTTKNNIGTKNVQRANATETAEVYEGSGHSQYYPHDWNMV